MPPLKNKKHELFLKKLTDPNSFKTKTEAYKSVYNCTHHSAAVASSKLLSFPEVKNRLTELLDARGLTLDFLNSRLKKLVDAKKQVYNRDGVLVATVDDNNIQLNALKVGYQLHNVLKPDNTINIDKSQNQLNIVTGDSSVSALEIIQELRELNENLALSKGEQTGEVIDV